MATGTSPQSDNSSSSEDSPDKLKQLYPAVDEEETPLPRSWSPKDKFNFIGLSQNNLRVHYKGAGKSHKDAASVRATHPIPASCGIYYFEVKIISKGRDGYMGIGVSSQGVNMNRLPGWEKYSYGYHGDDGNSFSSSSPGQAYGPTFTTGDTIGCCVNLIDSTVFYTKNGVSLGVAFSDIPANLYPTVGLQTPGEIVEANFGQSPFVFDIEDYMKEWRLKTKQTIERFPVSDRKGEFQTALHRIVSTYLVHHGYCSTAEAFSRSTGQPIRENIESIRNRQRIQKLVLAGRMGEAIETTQTLYPHLLEAKPDLLFMLKCRQFVEMVNGTDSEVCGGPLNSGNSPSGNVGNNGISLGFNNSNIGGRSPKSYQSAGGGGGEGGSGSNRSSPAHCSHPYVRRGTSPPSQHQHPSYHHNQQQQQQQQSNNHQQQQQQHQSRTTPTNSTCSSPNRSSKGQGRQSPNSLPSAPQQQQQQQQHQHNNNNYNGNIMNSSVITLNNNRLDAEESFMNSTNSAPSSERSLNGGGPRYIEGEQMDLSDGVDHSSSVYVQNGNSVMNGSPAHCDEDMDVDTPAYKRQMCGGNEVAIEKMLTFGRDLKMMSQRLRKEFGKNEANKRALQDAFSLLAYSDPWNSPIGGQLLPIRREPVCAALNSAILESKGLPKQPPLELAIAQTSQCMHLMSKSAIGSCAFASVSDFLH